MAYTSLSASVAQPGHEWSYEDEIFSPEPTWTVEPDIDIIRNIAQCELHIPEGGPCDVEFLAEGSFNKVYKIDCDNEESCVMRVSLPVHPGFKTECEVATIEFIGQNTEVLIAIIHTHDANFDNELDFEWMIQDFVTGESLEKPWEKVSMEKKEMLVRQIVAMQAYLFAKRFDCIGCLYHPDPLTLPPLPEWNPAMMPLLSFPAISPSYDLREVVSYQLFIGDHLSHFKSCRPYTSSRAWLAARIQPYVANALKVLTDTTLDADDYDRTASSAVVNIGMHLLMLLPKIFPSAEDEDKDSFILHHDDLHAQDILVDADGNLTGIIDWENIHTSPHWYARQPPSSSAVKLGTSYLSSRISWSKMRTMTATNWCSTITTGSTCNITKRHNCKKSSSKK